MQELTKEESRRLSDLFMASHEFVYGANSYSLLEFEIKKLLTPENLLESLFIDEFIEIKKRVLATNEIFTDYIQGFLREWYYDKKINIDFLIRGFMNNFSILFDEYLSYDYNGKIVMMTEVEDIDLPHFEEMINVLSDLTYYICLEEFYNEELKSNFKKKGNINIYKKNTYFEHTLSEDQLRYLYKELTQTHQYIDETKTSQIDFINVFTKPFNDHESKIYFSDETTQVAYLLFLLRMRFVHFYKCIEDSEKFISKENSIITSNNISSQLSKTIKKDISVKNQSVIENIILKIPDIQ